MVRMIVVITLFRRTNRKALLTIEHVLKNKDDAIKLLETKAGLLWINRIDDWYFDQLVETRIRLQDELNNNLMMNSTMSHLGKNKII